MWIFSLIKRTLKVRDKSPEKIKILLPLPFNTSVVHLTKTTSSKTTSTALNYSQFLIEWVPDYHGVCVCFCVTLSLQRRSERQFLWMRFIVLFSRLFQENISRLSCNRPQLLPSNSFQFFRKQIVYNLKLRNLRNSKSSLYKPRINNDFSIMSLHKRWSIFVFLLVCLHYDASQLCRLFAFKGLMQWIFLGYNCFLFSWTASLFKYKQQSN